MESALLCANYLKSHFLSLSQRLCVAEPDATCLSHSGPPASKSPIFHLHWPDKVVYPVLKYLPRFGMDLLFYLFWSFHFFLSIWKSSSIACIHKLRKPFDSPSIFRSFSPPTFGSCLNTLFSIFYSFFLESKFILSPPPPPCRCPPWSVYFGSNF